MLVIPRRCYIVTIIKLISPGKFRGRKRPPQPATPPAISAPISVREAAHILRSKFSHPLALVSGICVFAARRDVSGSS